MRRNSHGRSCPCRQRRVRRHLAALTVATNSTWTPLVTSRPARAVATAIGTPSAAVTPLTTHTRTVAPRRQLRDWNRAAGYARQPTVVPTDATRPTRRQPVPSRSAVPSGPPHVRGAPGTLAMLGKCLQGGWHSGRPLVGVAYGLPAEFGDAHSLQRVAAPSSWTDPGASTLRPGRDPQGPPRTRPDSLRHERAPSRPPLIDRASSCSVAIQRRDPRTERAGRWRSSCDGLRCGAASLEVEGAGCPSA